MKAAEEIEKMPLGMPKITQYMIDLEYKNEMRFKRLVERLTEGARR